MRNDSQRIDGNKSAPDNNVLTHEQKAVWLRRKSAKISYACLGAILGAGVACAIVLPLTLNQCSTNTITFDQNTVLEKQSFYKQINIPDFKETYNPLSVAKLYEDSANEKKYILTDALHAVQNNIDMFFHRGNVAIEALEQVDHVGSTSAELNEILYGTPSKYNGTIKLEFNAKTHVFSLYIQEWITSLWQDEVVPFSDKVEVPTKLYLSYDLHNYQVGWIGGLRTSDIVFSYGKESGVRRIYSTFTPASNDPNISYVEAQGNGEINGTAQLVNSINIGPEYLESVACMKFLSANFQDAQVVNPTTFGVNESTPITITNDFGCSDFDSWATLLNNDNAFYLSTDFESIYDSVLLGSSQWNVGEQTAPYISNIYIDYYWDEDLQEDIWCCQLSLLPGFVFSGDQGSDLYQNLAWPTATL